METDDINVTESASEKENYSEPPLNDLTDSTEAVDIITTDPKPAGSESISKPIRYLKLPFSKIKQIMKMDPDVMLVQQDAVFLVAKATEMFIEYITKETNKQLVGSKRKTVAKRDVEATIESISQLCFLDGALE